MRRIWLACVLLTARPIAGNVVGYLLGRRVGTALFKPDARLLKTEYLDKTHAFFERYGSRALILARFVPVVRTFITILAGASRMDIAPLRRRTPPSAERSGRPGSPCSGTGSATSRSCETTSS